MKLRYCFALILTLLCARAVNAAPITLSDVNSTFTVESRSQTGAYSWQVDGTEQLFTQWFWYRVGSTGSDQSVDTLPFVFAFGSNTNANPGLDRLQIQYQNSLFRLDIQYNLFGGTAGSNTSTVKEIITITNRTASALPFHFFEYADFNLNNTAGDDTAQLLTPSSIQQTDPAGVQATTTVTQSVPNHYEIATVPTTISSLNDGSPTTLSDTLPLVGPSDVAFAFEWDPIIAASSSFVIKKEKVFGPGGPMAIVPEPGALVLVGTGLVALYRRRQGQMSGPKSGQLERTT